MKQPERWWKRGVLTAALAGLIVGAAVQFFGRHDWAAMAWNAGVVPALTALLATIVRDLRRGRVGVDAIAVIAMAGALALRQPLAGAVIAAMYASGIVLEDFAVARAERELSALVQRTPRIAHRREDGLVADIPVERIAVGDRLLIRSGEVIAVDGTVADAIAIIDESALTGEAIPVTRRSGQPVASGTLNAGDAFDLIVTATVSTSLYARIVELARAAQTGKAEFVRLADRFALLLLPFSLLTAGAAWLWSGDPARALAVMVVATPCPLILAIPIAFVSGLSRAARRGILIKGAGALETMARATVLVFDKTGTLTLGGARVNSLEPAPGWNEATLLRAVASLEQASHHVVADALVKYARERGVTLEPPTAVHEQQGAGLEGIVDGKRVRAGSLSFVFSAGAAPEWARAANRRAAWRSALSVFATVDGELAGAILLADEIRLETPRAIRALRSAGISRITMVTGDRADAAETIAAALDIDAVLAERIPQDKIDAVREERQRGVTMMVGDGINDAPALAAADVGVAMGARGATASSEAADVVILVDRLDRVSEAIAIARRTRRIAVESASLGMALSVAAMIVAAIGWLPPVAGAVFQEGVDVLAILNALRSLLPAKRRPYKRMSGEMSGRLHRSHKELLARLDTLRDIAARLGDAQPPMRVALIQQAASIVREQVVPHERDDERNVYPQLDRLIGDSTASAAMGRAHREILHLARLLALMAADASPETADDLFAYDAQRILLSLEAIMRLHNAQEDEMYDSLTETPVPVHS
jgi:heavy metal translocating P-type ATPase